MAPWQQCMMEMRKQAADKEALKGLRHLPDGTRQLGLLLLTTGRSQQNLPQARAFYVTDDGMK